MQSRVDLVKFALFEGKAEESAQGGGGIIQQVLWTASQANVFVFLANRAYKIKYISHRA